MTVASTPHSAGIPHTIRKIHRHHRPQFCGALPRHVAVRRFCAALAKHDWNRNRFIVAMRQQNGQRLAVRSERRETFDALAMAVLAYCDYNPDSEYLFEVMCGVEQLARLTGQLHQGRDQRKTYDPVLKALGDWERAGLIIILRGFDPDTRQHKAMRIWVRPAFFDGMGISISALRDTVTAFRRWLERKGLRESRHTLYARHVMRIANSNVAQLDKHQSLKRLLRKIRHAVVGDDASLLAEKRRLTAALSAKQADRIREPSLTAEIRYYRWRNTRPIAVYLPLEQNLRKTFPNIVGENWFQLLLDHLPME
ncbi:hypothetical protein B7L32_22995 [Serratia marcescens]|nr:hypothetical protein B7L32_22995 [Serratia marcescens]